MSLQRTPPPGGGNTSQNRATINELTKKLEKMEEMCKNLSKEIIELKAENSKLKSVQSKDFQTSDIAHFSTDEEELTRETDWILKKRPAKKRKAESSPELSKANDEDLLPSKPTKGNTRPPPIMVSGDCNYQQLYTLTKTESKENFTIKLLNNGVYKVNTFSIEDYRKLSKTFSTKNISWYSFENKQTRPIKVVVKKLHHSCEAKAIVEDLRKQGLNALSAHNKLKWKTKEPLDMFLLTFDSMENVKKIYEIKTILNSVVSIEPVKSSNLIPQCKLCQSYGHTQNYCGKQPRCVKCAGKHKSIDCSKPEKEKPKCCNCGEAHPASYRGCVVPKELQKMRSQKVGQEKKKELPAPYTTKSNQINEENSEKSMACNYTLKKQTPQQLTYAHVLKQNTTTTACSGDALAQILQKLDEQMDFNKALEIRLSKLEIFLSESNHV